MLIAKNSCRLIKSSAESLVVRAVPFKSVGGGGTEGSLKGGGAEF